jgi:hypothetical protein
MNIYILTSDKSIHIIEAFQYAFNKYWGCTQKVFILGYSDPQFELEENFKFISLGKDIGPRVGGQLIDFFNCIKDEHFIFGMDDFPLISSINRNILDHATLIMKEDPTVGRFGLTGDTKDRQHIIIDSRSDYEVIMNAQNVDYKLSGVWSMWNKKYFLKYLVPSMNLWDWEINGSSLSKNDGFEVIGTNKKYAINACHIYKQGKLKSNWYESVWDKSIKIEDSVKIYVKKIIEKKI